MIEVQQLIEMNMRLSNLEQLVRNIVEPNQWMDIRKAAKYSGVSETTLRRSVNRGTLKCSHRTGKLLFQRHVIDRWLNG